MGDVLVIALLLGIPWYLFLRASWKRDQRDRERWRRGELEGNASGKDPRSHWGGMGRPGSGGF